MSDVRRFMKPLTRARLLKALSGEPLPAEPLHTSIPLDDVVAALEGLPAEISGPGLDQALVEPLHRALASLTKAEAADMRVWHWLAADQFADFVWRRWRPGGSPQGLDLEGALTEAMIRRFAGPSSLVGVSRNTFARLWWTAEQLDGDYDLARFALSRQDMFQAVFERLFGLYRPASTSALNAFRGRSEDEIREAARWLNYAAATTLLEALTADEVQQLLMVALQPGTDGLG